MQQHISPEAIFKDLKGAICKVQWMGLMICCGINEYVGNGSSKWDDCEDGCYEQ
jgi:hypothetical protein